MTVVKTLWIRHTFKNVTSLLIFFHRYVGRRNYTAWISRTATNIKQLHTVLVRHELYVFEDFFFFLNRNAIAGPKQKGGRNRADLTVSYMIPNRFHIGSIYYYFFRKNTYTIRRTRICIVRIVPTKQ